MPTFYDPVADADEASQALRGLAHASLAFEHPEDAYGVIGDLLSGVRSLQQSIRQLATRHTQHEGRAFNDAGDQADGIRDADATARKLSDAATALDAVEERLNNASAAAGRIAWHPAGPDAGTSRAAEPAIGDVVAGGGGVVEPVERWVNVVFLQRPEADEVLWLIDRDGAEAAIDHLAGYDYGQETTDAAMENGYVYDTPPASALDKEAVQDDYTLIHNPDMGHVGLYRRHQVHPADRIDTTTDKALATGLGGGGVAAGAAAGSGAAAGAAMAGKAFGHRATSQQMKSQAAAKTQPSSWFAHPGVEAVKQERGISR